MEKGHISMPLALDENKPVFMFSGQGSQKIGMGQTLFGRPLVDEVFACASDVFGFDVAQVMTEGSEKTLNDTRFAQAAIVCLSLALAYEIKSQGKEASAILGFSLGQVSAAYASGMLSMEDTLKFAKIRSELMADAAQETEGKMCALLGADEEQAQALCDECAHEEVLVIANYNCPGQIVISGHKAAVLRAQEAWTAQKKRSALLATSGAFHSPLMAHAAEKLGAYLETQVFNAANTPLMSNLDACPLSAARAREHFSAHLTHPVRFEQSVDALVGAGAHNFVEIGYGGVLIGLVKRINRKSERYMVESAETLDAFFK